MVSVTHIHAAEQDREIARLRRALDRAMAIIENGWLPIDTAPLGEMVWLWHRAWRHPFPGQRNGDGGHVYVDTCEPEARGWQAHASHWMPMARPMTGFFAALTPDQQKAALAYQGPDSFGDPNAARRIEARSDETPKASQPAGREPDGEAGAP